MDIDFNILNSYEDDTLRPYQQDLKSKVYEEWATKKSVMLQMPTGTGKTKLFCSIITDVHNFSKVNKKAFKVLVLTHKEELVRQVVDEITLEYNIACGVIQSRAMEFRKIPTQVACVPTLIRRLDKWTFKDFDLIIVDEAHHIKADSYQKIIKAFDRAKLLGLTATPYRLSGEGFTKEFDSLITSPTIKEFQKDGFLSQYHYYSIGKDSFVQRTINGIVKEDIQGDYDSNELSRLYDKDKIRAQIVETYQKYANGKKGIVYTINQEHNKHLLTAFTEVGIKAAAIDSKTDSIKRTEIIDDFRNGKYDILLNVNIFSEGFDCPDIEFIQLARPTKSMSMYLQQVGRGLRPHKNKDAVIILDNVGLYNRFGLPSAKRNWNFYFKGREINETGKKFVKRSLEFENKQREKDLSEGNEKVDLIYTSYDEILGEEYEDILDPGIANEVAEHLYKRYCACAQNVFKEYYQYRYELCKHELGYYYLQSENPNNNIDDDNDVFNLFIKEKLSRKGGKYTDIISKWDFDQLSIFEVLYNRIQISRQVLSVWWYITEEKFDLKGCIMEYYLYLSELEEEDKDNNFKYDMFKVVENMYKANKLTLKGYSRFLHSLFSTYGKGNVEQSYKYPNILSLFLKFSWTNIELKDNLNFIFYLYWRFFDDRESLDKIIEEYNSNNNDSNNQSIATKSY